MCCMLPCCHHPCNREANNDLFSLSINLLVNFMFITCQQTVKSAHNKLSSKCLFNPRFQVYHLIQFNSVFFFQPIITNYKFASEGFTICTHTTSLSQNLTWSGVFVSSFQSYFEVPVSRVLCFPALPVPVIVCPVPDCFHLCVYLVCLDCFIPFTCPQPLLSRYCLMPYTCSPPYSLCLSFRCLP